MIPNVLSIAGSDPSGGAGIQADLKAISANGAFAMAVLTALTAQNTQGVSGIHLVPPGFVQNQIDMVFDDIRVDAVKIGMIANREIAQAVTKTLSGRDSLIILDPVMIAKGGAALLQPDAIAMLRDALLPMAAVLTPNLPEAAQLLGADVATTRTDIETQGRALCALGPAAILMKGGHLRGADSPDCLVTADTVTWFEGARIPTHNTHGTGCTLSSALAAQLAKTGDIQTATAAAKSYVATAIANADQLSVGSGHGQPIILPTLSLTQGDGPVKSILFGAALSLCAAPLSAQDQMTLLLDWFVNPDHGPIIIAQEMGFFADVDLTVDIVAPADPSDPPKLVAAGRADLAISYQPQLHLHIHEGLPLQRVGTLVATPLNCLLVLKDGPISSPADLVGGRIGFSVGGVEKAVLGHVLETHGLTLDDVELVNVNWSLSPSLMSGQVDAVIGAFRNFELNQMDMAGVPGRCFYVEEEGLPPYDELIYVANPSTMDADMIRRFLAATEKATQYIINHPQESWKIFSSTAPELQDELNQRAWADTLPRFALRPTAMDVGRYAAFETFLYEAGLIPEVNPVAKIAIDLTAQ